MVKEITFFNVNLLCKKHFVNGFFVLSIDFVKYLENLATFLLA